MASASAAAVAAVQIQAVVKGLPTVQSSARSGNLQGATSNAKRTGLRLRGERDALKSSFNNGGTTIAPADCGSAAGGGSRIQMKVASKGAYICRDCGYIYSDRTPFEKLSSDYSCPVCAAPKRRFKPYEAPVAKNANTQSVRKARKTELKEAEGLGSLPIGIAIGAAVLVGVYIYTNTAF